MVRLRGLHIEALLQSNGVWGSHVYYKMLSKGTL